MITYEEALDHIWDVLHSYAEKCLGNKIGQDEHSMKHADEWSEICLSMATIKDGGIQMSLDGPAQSQREDEINAITDGIYNHIEGKDTDILEPLIKEAIDTGLAEVNTEYEYDPDSFRLEVLMALDIVLKKEIARLVVV